MINKTYLPEAFVGFLALAVAMQMFPVVNAVMHDVAVSQPDNAALLVSVSTCIFIVLLFALLGIYLLMIVGEQIFFALWERTRAYYIRKIAEQKEWL